MQPLEFLAVNITVEKRKYLNNYIMENKEENQSVWVGDDDCAGQPIPLTPPDGANPNGEYKCVNGVITWIEDLGE